VFRSAVVRRYYRASKPRRASLASTVAVANKSNKLGVRCQPPSVLLQLPGLQPSPFGPSALGPDRQCTSRAVLQQTRTSNAISTSALGPVLGRLRGAQNAQAEPRPLVDGDSYRPALPCAVEWLAQPAPLERAASSVAGPLLPQGFAVGWGSAAVLDW
jgi:hypothetical protein